MEVFNKGRAVYEIERAQKTADGSRIANTSFEAEALSKIEGYADLKLTNLTTGSSFSDESFNRIRTAAYVGDNRYSLNPKSTTWVLYSTHPTVYEIQDTGLTASSSVWMTEETSGYCYIIGTDDDTTLTVFQFDGGSLSEITLSSSIGYSTNIDVATLPSGELFIARTGAEYYIVSQNGDVSTGKMFDSAVDQVFVERAGNAVVILGVTSGDIISAVTIDGANYKNWNNWALGDRDGDDGDVNSSYAVQLGTGIQVVDTHVQAGGFSALASDGTNHYLFIATNGGYQIIEPDFSDIEADISQTLTLKDKANSTIVAHGYYEDDLYTLVLDNSSTPKTLSVYRGVLSQSKTLSSIEQSTTITLPTLSAPERLYGLRESFYQNSDNNPSVFSVYFGFGVVSSNLVGGGSEQDTLQTVTDRGATTTNEISIPSVQFDTTQTLTPTSGQLGWNADDETLDLGLNGGGVVHKLGETLFFNVKAAEAISKGNVLYASGAVGNSGKIEASKYIANNTIEENRVLGVAAEDISIGDFGFVYFLGSLRGITTNGSDVGETWVDGTILYASATTAGALTSVQPIAPNQDIPIAFVTSAKATNGAIYIRATQLGYHLGELHDVYVPSPSDGEVLTWSNANQRWEAGAGGGVETDTLDSVTSRGNITTNNITVNGLTATTDPIDAQGDLRAQSNLRFDAYAPVSGHNLLIVGTNGTVFTRDEDYYTTEGWVNSQGYATQTWVNQQGFATQVWVLGQGYVDENLSSLSFNVADGVLTASLSGGTQTAVDLDGRYLQSVALNDLTDVDAASNKNDGAVMQWSSVLNRFVLSNTLDLRIEGSDLLADNSPTAGQVYQYNGTTFQWATVTSGGVGKLNDIGDVSVPSPSTNDVLTWNGSTWVASASGGGSADGVVNGATFIGGLLSLQRSLGLPDVSVNLDGRYLRDFTEVDPKGVASIAFSGTNTKTLTITLRDSTTVQASFTDLQGGGGSVSDGVVNGATFNTSNGELTLSRTEGLPDVVVDLDGRYATQTGMTFWRVRTDNNGTSYQIQQGNTVIFHGNEGIAATHDSNGTIKNVYFELEDLGVTNAKIANSTIEEEKLNISNAPTDGKYLRYYAGSMLWADEAIKVYNNWSSSIVSISVFTSGWTRIDNYTTENNFNSVSMVSESAGVFTVATAGVYEITYRVRLGLTSSGESYRCGLSVGGAVPSEDTTSDSLSGVGNLQMTTQLSLVANEQVDLRLISTKNETINTNRVFISFKKLS